jgi:uncharacterized protein
MSLELVLLAIASLLAGVIDSIVGGGGLVLVPALFATFPSAPPATLLGTNKLAAIWGTLIASRQYSKRVNLEWRVLIPAAAFALLGSFCGAWAVTLVDPTFMRRLLPLVLIAVLLYTLWNKNLGTSNTPRYSGARAVVVTSAIGGVIGFYDGFFGPGAGSFFVFLLVRWMGYDFLNASASAKVLNVATNFAALVLFTLKGHVWWQVGLILAVANIAGSIMGAHLALKYGASFVRRIFIGVVSMLILKTTYDTFLR